MMKEFCDICGRPIETYNGGGGHKRAAGFHTKELPFV